MERTTTVEGGAAYLAPVGVTCQTAVFRDPQGLRVAALLAGEEYCQAVPARLVDTSCRRQLCRPKAQPALPKWMEMNVNLAPADDVRVSGQNYAVDKDLIIGRSTAAAP
jgi:hypothetical protein